MVQRILTFMLCLLVNPVYQNETTQNKLPEYCGEGIELFTDKYSCPNDNDISFEKGRKSVLFLINEKETDETHILKITQVQPENFETNPHYFMSDLLKESSHIVNRKEKELKDDLFYEIIEYGEQGTLLEFVDEHDTFDDQKEALTIFLDIVNGALDMHNVGYVHADLKPANIIIKNNSPKLIDFDLSVKINTYATGRGSISFISPGILENWGKKLTKFTSSVDVWSLGLILYYMINNKNVFSLPQAVSDKKQQLQIIKEGSITFPIGMSFEVIQIILACLRLKPKKRIHIKTLRDNIVKVLNDNDWQYINTTVYYNIKRDIPKSFEDIFEEESTVKWILQTNVLVALFCLFLIIPAVALIIIHKRKS